MNKLTYLFLLSMLLGISQLQGQEYLDLIHNPTQLTTLDDIQNLAESYFENRDKGRGSGYKQYKRWEYKMERMVNEDRKILNFSKLNWDAAQEVQQNFGQENAANWTPIGPTSYTNGNSGYNGGLGRVNLIAFHPTNANTLYIGTPAGGMWRTTDGGTSWLPMTDNLASIGVSGIAVDHSNPNTMYILTGDGDGADTYSIGIMKSTDGGSTWAATGLSWNITNFIRGYKLVMHPTNSNIMLAVTNAGIYRTTDGWNTWSNVQSGSFRDIEIKPGDPTTMFAVTTNQFYRSTNSGASWSTVSSGLPSGENRIAIAVTAANPNYVYYLAGPGGASGSGTFNGLYRSTDSGLSFSARSTSPNILGYDPSGGGSSDQSWYDLALAVNPADANNTITGGVNVWRSTNGGATHSMIAYWYSPSATQYVHADIHDLVYNPLNNLLYCGSDGGISVSSDNGQTWTNIWNGLQIAQFYKIAGVETNENLLIGGTQDNGSNKYTGSANIEHILGGDGMDCMIDYNNTNTIYYSWQNGGLRRSTNGGSTSTGIQPGGSTGAWVTPYTMDASNPNIIYAGYNDVYRSTNQGTSWTNLGADGRGALLVGINDPARLYAAVGSTLRTSANTGGSWTTISGSLPNLTITDVAVDPADATRVWVTFGGYTSGQKVYESTNAGSSWTNISSGLPNAPALSIAYENTGGSPMDAIYVGTSTGVYYRDDATSWTIHNAGLPNVPIYDLEINHTSNKIRAGTYGRGLWETPLYNSVACDIASTGVTVTPPSCPGDSDGTLTVTATCTSCASIVYTITPTSPAGAPITQTGNGVFTNLPANIYNVSVQDSADASCNDTWTSNPVNLPDGSDTSDPAINCPSDMTVACGSDTSPAATGTAAATDNCDTNPSVSFSDVSSANCGNTEIITRTWTAIDASGNSISCDQIITVTDTTDPTISCPSDITASVDSGSCTAVITYSNPTGSDGCGSVTITQTSGLGSGAAFPVGTTINTFEITDACGNTSSCSFSVTIQDAENPVINCPADTTVQCGTDTSPTTTGNATAADNCDSNPSVTFSDVSTSGCGSTEVITRIWTAVDSSGNSISCDQIITVVDTTDPVATCPSDITTTTDAGSCTAIITYSNPTGSDNCGGVTITQTSGLGSGAAFPVGTTVNTFEITDACGNTVSCSFSVTIQDGENPVINCPADTTVQCGTDTSPTTTGNATAADNCDSNPTVTYSDTSTSGCGSTEVITRTWTAIDSSGNSISCDQIITVVDTIVPVATCPSDIITDTDAGSCTAIITFSAPTATDNCGGVSMTQVSGLASGSAFPLGVTVNTFEFTDDCGNTTSCSFDILVQDNEDPTITCPADQTVQTDTGSSFYTVPDYFGSGLASVSDNCTDPVSITTQDPAAGSMIPEGTYTVTLTAEDDAGNLSSCTFQLMVESILGRQEVNGMSSLKLALNPVRELLVLSNPQHLEISSMYVYDLTGKRIMTFNPNTNSDPINIDVSGLASGTYLLVITGNNGNSIFKIVKE